MTYLKKISGFTLLELVIVILILSIIAGLGSKILAQAFTGYFDNKYLAEADWQARLGLERMQRDIRAVRSTADITTATGTQFAFTNYYGNTINYSLSANNLILQYNSGTAQILATGINSLTFSYYDRNGASTSTLANIRSVTISLNVTLDNTNYIATTSVYLRNLS